MPNASLFITVFFTCLSLGSSVRALDAISTKTLYAHRLMIGQGGVPRLAVGLASGRRQVQLSAPNGMQVIGQSSEDAPPKIFSLGPQALVRWKKGQAAQMRYAVAVATLEGAQRGRRTSALKLWRKRGERPYAQDVGLVFGLSGVVVDNRATLILIRRSASRTQTERAARQVHDKYGLNAQVIPTVMTLPQQWIEVSSGGTALRLLGSVVFASLDSQPLAVDAIREGPNKKAGWRQVPGLIAIAPDVEGLCAVVNVTSVDAILKGVVPSEMFASAPLEALKAQAITARGAVFAKLGRRHFADPFTLCNNEHCQVYSGYKAYHPRASQAVDETRGELLFLAGQIVDSVYSSTCGGHSEDAEVVWDMAPKAALRGHRDGPQAALELARRVRPFARGELGQDIIQTSASDLSTDARLRAYLKQPAKSYCAQASMVRPSKLRWSKRIESADMDRLMFRYGVGHVSSVTPTGRGVSGRVTGLRIVGGDGETVIQREWPVRQALGFLNSGAFVVDVERDAKGQANAFVFSGMGWGHGVGMCQVGAIGMAEQGLNNRDILRHYYNGAEVLKVY